MKLKRSIFLLIIICTLINKKVVAQVKAADSSNLKVLVSPGISSQREIFGELNIMLAKEVDGGGSCGSNGFSGLRVGFESNLKKDNFIIAPKIGYEVSAYPLCLRGNIIDYLSNGKSDLRLLPEIGISFNGYINLVYGYNFPLLKNKLTEISNSRITLTFNIGKSFLQD